MIAISFSLYWGERLRRLWSFRVGFLIRGMKKFSHWFLVEFLEYSKIQNWPISHSHKRHEIHTNFDLPQKQNGRADGGSVLRHDKPSDISVHWNLIIYSVELQHFLSLARLWTGSRKSKSTQKYFLPSSSDGVHLFFTILTLSTFCLQSFAVLESKSISISLIKLLLLLFLLHHDIR